MSRSMTRGLTTLALAGGLAAAPTAAALAAPTYELNKAGHGITTFMINCGGSDLTILINNNSSATGGWGAARVVGGGVLVPTSLSFTYVDMANGTVLASMTQQKGGGNVPAGTLTCTSPVMDAGATIADLVAAGQLTASQLPTGVALTDEAGFTVSATVFRHG
jgi:hypothetical protein